MYVSFFFFFFGLINIDLYIPYLANWQPIDLSTMIFPAEFKVDYVRVYQRKGQMNTGCSPVNYPTAEYISDHLEAYTSMCGVFFFFLPGSPDDEWF